jgi:hypothetical protein
MQIEVNYQALYEAALAKLNAEVASGLQLQAALAIAGKQLAELQKAPLRVVEPAAKEA